MVNVYIKERINDQTTICAGGVTSNTTYLGIYGLIPVYVRRHHIATRSLYKSAVRSERRRKVE